MLKRGAAERYAIPAHAQTNRTTDRLGDRWMRPSQDSPQRLLIRFWSPSAPD